jgi:tetratricopeptide (TPR) repeat protein
MRTTLLLLLLCCPAIADESATAKEHYLRGTKLFDLTRYREAAHEYQTAYELKDEPALLFNIAQAYRLGGDYDEAIKFYKSYLHRVPRSRQRKEVETRISEMSALVAERERQKSAPPEGTLRPDSPSDPEVAPPKKAADAGGITAPEPAAITAPKLSPVTEAPWKPTKFYAGAGVGAFGLASAIAGIACGVVAMQTATKVQNAGSYDESLGARGRALGYSADALLAVGGAAIVTGAILMVIGRKHAERVRPLASGVAVRF